MRNLFRLKVKVKTYIRGNVNSNTFFGVYCQAYKMIHDDEELQIFLECLADNSEELTFSDMLMPGTTDLLNIQSDTATKSEFIPHCMISRDNNGNNETYSTENKYIKKNNCFDILLYTSLSKKGVEKLSQIVELLGIGADKSTGSGNIQILSVDEEDKSILENHGPSMKLLANIVPDEDTPTHGQFNFTVRQGITKDGVAQSKIIQLQAGSLLVNNTVDKPTYGRVVFDEQSKTYINCKAIAV